MAEVVSNAIPSLGVLLKVADVAAMTTPVTIAGLTGGAWSGFEVDSVDVTEQSSELFFDSAAANVKAYRSVAGRCKVGQWNCTGRMILSAAVTGNQQDNILEILAARTPKYFQIVFITGGDVIGSGFWKNYETSQGETGAQDASWVIELDGRYLDCNYA